jgi:hypothetical protein
VQREICLTWIGICMCGLLLISWPASLVYRVIFLAMIWAAVHGFMAWFTRRDPQWYELVPLLLWNAVKHLFKRSDVLDY